MQSLGHLFSASLAPTAAPSTSEQEVEETYPRRQLLFSKSQLEVRVLYNREPLDDLEGGHPGVSRRSTRTILWLNFIGPC
jgi:hypothetical protein